MVVVVRDDGKREGRGRVIITNTYEIHSSPLTTLITLLFLMALLTLIPLRTLSV